ncbi:MAG TPA: hypothetical protein VMH24_02170, partial [Candidatus Sulfotelmatobacter sp.]|nr:hypothetical protein [Candidatus Sulfotelmatobacter sp.]
SAAPVVPTPTAATPLATAGQTSQFAEPTATFPQPVDGQGWRLLGAVELGGGEPATITVAIDEATFARDWSDAMGAMATPKVDLTHEVVVFFHPLVDVACPDLNLTGIGVQKDQRLVYGLWSPAYVVQPSVCSDVAGSHTVAVALDRGSLPVGAVTFRNKSEYQLSDPAQRSQEQVTVTL